MKNKKIKIIVILFFLAFWCLLFWLFGCSGSYDEYVVKEYIMKDKEVIENIALKVRDFIKANFNETTGVILNHYDLDVILEVKGKLVDVIITQSEDQKTPKHSWMHKIRIWFCYSYRSEYSFGKPMWGSFEIKKWTFGSENSEEIINKKGFGYDVQGKKLKSFCYDLIDILEPWMQKKQRRLVI